MFSYSFVKKLDDTNQSLVNSIIHDFEHAATKLGARQTALEELPDGGVIVAIGGDGTTLMAMRKAAAQNSRVVAIHAGRLGFLTDFNPQDANSIPKMILDCTLKSDKRWLLESKIGGETFYSANEFSIADNLSGNAHWFGFKFGNFNGGHILGDGLILATPTGSTGYALSSGGSILYPESNNAMLSAIAPTSLSFRSVTVPINDEVSLECIARKDSTIVIKADGQTIHSVELQKGEKMEIEVKKSPSEIVFLRRPDWCFFTLLAEKMHWNEQLF